MVKNTLIDYSQLIMALKLCNILKKVLYNNHKSFIFKSFKTLHPITCFQENWHIDLIIDYLKAVEQGKIKRLIINIPPRSMKSICVSVAWPAFLLARNPSKKIIVVSYSQALSYKHSQDCRTIMHSNWFKHYFPETKITKGNNNKAKLATSKQGFRFATSVGGTLTGEGADIIILDDPQSPLRIQSNNEREKTIKWFEQTLISRLNDKINGRIVIVMQRLHADDLSGHLINKGGWDLLKIPIIAESEELINFGDFQYKRSAGELLDNKRYDDCTLNQIKQEMGNYAFSAQYQQEPKHLNSSFIKQTWLKYYLKEEIQHIKDEIIIYQSWDCAIKAKDHSDYSVCLTIGVANNCYYLLDVFREKLEYPYLKKSVIKLYEKFQPNTILLEDKASGQQLIQELTLSGINNNCKNVLPIIPIIPKYDKLTRMILISPIFESGRFFLDKTALWKDDFENELFNFPYSKHDDQVDSLVQFLNWSYHNMNFKKVLNQKITVL